MNDISGGMDGSGARSTLPISKLRGVPQQARVKLKARRITTCGQLLLAAARAGEAALTLPVHRGERGHPAIFAASLFGELADPSLKGGARTVTYRHLAQALLVDVDDSGVLIDVDTPEIYRTVLTGEGQ